MDEAPITAEEWSEWQADRRTQKLLAFIAKSDGEIDKEIAENRDTMGDCSSPADSMFHASEIKANLRAKRWLHTVNVAITGTAAIVADGRRVTVQG